MIQQSCSWAFSQEKWKHVHNETCARMFITALLTIDPNWQKNKYAKTRELINQGIIISWEALSSKREWTSITYNNFDESPKYYSNLKRPDTKEYTLYNFIHLKFYKRKKKLWWEKSDHIFHPARGNYSSDFFHHTCKVARGNVLESGKCIRST